MVTRAAKIWTGDSPITIAPDNDGIIGAVNSQPQTSNWTPVGETFYEATRYFRGMSSAYDGDENNTKAQSKTTVRAIALY